MGAQPLTGRWLVVVDFDGTITEHDTLDLLCHRHAPAESDAADAALLAGEITLDECIRRQFEAVRGDHDELVAEAVAGAGVRAGFAGFVERAQAAGHRVVVVSSGFESVIRPVLESVGLGDLEVMASEVRFSPEGSRVEFPSTPVCERCGERCKRPLVAALDGSGPVAYIGDGWSDRCAALAADRRFARDSLARYLDGEQVEYVRFDDFDVIREELL
jgi:2-hydroxy-3-keto-5-methylthiopentenyl-1-phosphate phosphatase